MAKDLIFEIGTEELPASFIPRAQTALAGFLKKTLEARRLGFASLRTLGTPRRLTLIVDGLEEKQPDSRIEVKGPQTKAAFDDKGVPTKALTGFANSQGVDIKDVKTLKTEKAEYVYVVKEIKGEKTAKILPGILKGVISEDFLPKSMRWGSYDISFARPIHWILAAYGGKTVDFTFGHIKSSSVTFGHRFLSGSGKSRPKPIKVDSIKTYIEKLMEACVIADPAERKDMITEGLLKNAKEIQGAVMADEALLDEVTYLTEFPVVLRGSFDKEFLSMPRDVIVNAMREHQRYFSVIGVKGELLPYFLTVANTKAKDMDVITKGNERVLRARLNDAKFYFEQDIKTRLADRVDKLKGVVFQAKLGTSYEKVERFTRLALFIGSRAGFSEGPDASEKPSDFLTDSYNPARYSAKDVNPAWYGKLVIGRGAMLAKADLVSGMVGEFPKLQGTMGSVYAQRGGEVPEISVAIYEHYLPAVSGGAIPASVPGAIISIADKADTIAGCFGVGLIPTGAQDPYALRRQALGIIAIIIDKGFTLPLDEVAEFSIALLDDKLTHPGAEVKRNVLEFFKDRLKHLLLGQGMSFDSIDAVLSTNWFDIVDAVKRVHALEGFKKHPACANLVTAFKRVSNILKGLDLKDRHPDPGLFTDQEEKDLYESSVKVAPEIKGFLKDADYAKAFEALASIKDRIDAFFDHTMVMVEDEKVKENRLLLLNSVRGLYYKTADLSKLMI